MANMVASPLLRVLSDRLTCIIHNSLNMKNLQLTLAELQTLVLEGENKQNEEDAIRRWITELKGVAYEADNVLDEFNRLSISTFLNPLQCLARFNLQRKMKYVEVRLNALLDRRMKYQKASTSPAEGLSSYDGTGNVNFKVLHRETSSSVCGPEVFGRMEDRLILMDRLLCDSDTQFKVVPIVGMGGLGKTTLAQLIYNDETIIREFDRRYWVSVSQVFDLRMIGKAIMETSWNEKFGVKKPSCFLSNTEETVDAIVRDELTGKRFFIVLDDVWDENQDKLDVLHRWFAVGARGSAVLMTTRSANVADLVATVEPSYTLKPLSDDDAWLLFRHVAFNSKDEENNVKLVEIGKGLVDRCKGLPLAIKTLAGLMRKREESEWLQIKDDNMWELPEFGSSVLPALRLSYNHLPSHLKQCFAYCSIFPQGVTIDKERLIRLWIAEGFVQSTEGNRSLEDIGNDYFMELWRRSFFVKIWRDDDFGEIVKGQMHYLIHDLAHSVASVGCSILGSRILQNAPEEVRHSSVAYDSDDQQSTILELLQKTKKLRTLLLFSSNLEKIPGILFKLTSLRALDLSGNGIQNLSKSVARLTHLRYLNLSRTHIEKLPDSIGKLQSLYTLELIECYSLQELPNSICKLTNLRHLDIESCCSLSHMPYGIGKLRLLQILPLFILRDIDGCSDIGELNELDIRGKLEIKNLEFVGRAENANLHKKHKLRSLKLSWSRDAKISPEYSHKKVLEKLMPPQELKVLHIIDYKGESYPSWIMNSLLENLAKLSLINCSCEHLPPLGDLPNLKHLYIKQMLAVEIIDNAFYGGDDTASAKPFPSLQQLELYDIPNLKVWWSFRSNQQFGSTEAIEASSSSSVKSVEAFPCLKFLTIKGCSKLSRLPELPKLQNLALWNCNEELLLSLDNLASLSTLVINEFRRPLALPLPNLKSIKNITIYDCENLLARLDDDMKYFSSVEHLRILYCDALELLPLGLGNLTSLKKLEIAECPELAHVPDVMQNLHSLEELIIVGCPKLKSLPNSISQIKLEKLAIHRCPELCKKMQTENSEQWCKTAHISCIDKESEEYVTEEKNLSEPSY